MTQGGIKSKERVSEFGEVFTPEHIVKEMLDLVKEQSYNIEDTFLEPACGNGNFLVEILARKLETAKRDIDNFNINVIKALCSIYGVDIQHDNVEESKARMLEVIKSAYNSIGKELTANDLKTYIYILDKNIIWGDTLTAKFMGDIYTGKLYESTYKKYDDRPELKFVEWKIADDKIEITEFTLEECLNDGAVPVTESYEHLGLDEFLFTNVKETKAISIDSLHSDIPDTRLEYLLNLCQEYRERVNSKFDNIMNLPEAVGDYEENVHKTANKSNKKSKTKVITAW